MVNKLILTGMANAFNDFFTNVGPNLDNDIPKNPRSPSIYIQKNRIPESFLIAPTTPNELCEIIGALYTCVVSHSLPYNYNTLFSYSFHNITHMWFCHSGFF